MGKQGSCQSQSIDELLQLYVVSMPKSKLDPALDDEGRLWFKGVEIQKQLRTLAIVSRDSLVEFNRICLNFWG